MPKFNVRAISNGGPISNVVRGKIEATDARQASEEFLGSIPDDMLVDELHATPVKERQV